jgi:release factor glutamine methyltransferase
MSGPEASWTILAILRWTADYFRAKEVPEPRASAEILLAHTLGLSRLDLYLRYDQPLNPEELARFKALVLRRRDGEPVAYLTGHREFWSLDIEVTPAVLIPRPETETLVAAALETARSSEPKNIDGGSREDSQPETENRKPKTSSLWGLEVGVGSGAVVIALAKELPEMSWVGLDRSSAALAVARANIRRHEVAHQVHLLQEDLLAGLKPVPHFALLVANLPYVPRTEWERLPREIKDFEPPEALLGGEDGLDLIRLLVRQAPQYVMRGGWVLLEVGDKQAAPVSALMAETGAYDLIDTTEDFNGIARVVRARRKPAGG